MTYGVFTASIVLAAAVAFVAATWLGRFAVLCGFPLPPKTRRIGCIDGLRGYLALAVLVHHFAMWIHVTRFGGLWLDLPVHLLNSLGKGSVALFFMITGLVFYPRALAGFQETLWLPLYVNRLFRILPLVLTSIVCVSIVIMLRTHAEPDRLFLPTVLTWATSWAEPPLLGYPDSGRLNAYVLWSLWYEWIFYVFLLPMTALCMDLAKGRVPTWCVPVSILVASLLQRDYPLRFVGAFLNYVPYFMIGMLAYECQSRPAVRRLLGGKAVGVTAILAIAVATSIAPTPAGIVQLCLYILFFTTVACGNDLCGLLGTPGSLMLGECSYSIYLLHGIVLSLIFTDAAVLIAPLSLPGLAGVLPLAALLVVCASAATYLLIERPNIALGHAIARTLRRPVAEKLGSVSRG